MASNVPLSRVKEAVVAAIVEKIPIVDGDPAVQRREIAAVVGRWGDLINRIGGVDPIETVCILQAHCATSTRMPLFGQILAALYQEDIVEEDDIRAWHKLPIAQGEGRKPGPETENLQKCLTIGAHMIRQFDEQESDSEEEESEDEPAKVAPKPVTAKVEETPETTEESESDDDDSKSSGDVSKETDSTDEEDGETDEGSEDSEE